MSPNIISTKLSSLTNTKLQKTALSGAVTLVASVVLMIGNMIVNPVIIFNLGIDALGLYSVVNGAFLMLLIIDNGSHHALVQSMYKPLADGDFATLKAINKFCRMWFRFVGGGMLIAGLIMLPFLGFIINDESKTTSGYILFVIFLVSMVTDYMLFVGFRLMLSADIRAYIFEFWNMIFTLLSYTCKIIVVVIFKSLILFALVEVLFVLLRSFFLYRKSAKLYSEIDSAPNIELPKIIRDKIIKLYTSQFALAIYGLSFGLIIFMLSIKTDLSVVGIYSLYIITLSTAIAGLIDKPITAIIPAIGQSAHIWNAKEALLHYKHLRLALYFLYSTIAAGLFICLQYFIPVWAGDNCMLSFIDTVLFVVTFFIGYAGSVYTKFMQAYGLQSKMVIPSIVALVVRLTVSVIFIVILNFGLTGALITILITELFTSWGIYQAVLYKQIFKSALVDFFKDSAFHLVQFGICLVVCYFATFWFDLGTLYFNFFGKGIIVVIISTALFIGINHRTHPFRSFWVEFIVPNVKWAKIPKNYENTKIG